MEKYQNFKGLLENFESLPVPGRIYIQANKINDKLHTFYWTISSKESKETGFIETENGNIPVLLKDLNVKSFLDSATFQDIIENKIDNNPQLDLQQVNVFFEAVNYYLENDDFED